MNRFVEEVQFRATTTRYQIAKARRLAPRLDRESTRDVRGVLAHRRGPADGPGPIRRAPEPVLPREVQEPALARATRTGSADERNDRLIGSSGHRPIGRAKAQSIDLPMGR